MGQRYYYLIVYDWLDAENNKVKRGIYASDMFDSLDVATSKLRYFDLATTTKQKIVKIRIRRMYQCTGKFLDV
jgi:hypothetical protein